MRRSAPLRSGQNGATLATSKQLRAVAPMTDPAPAGAAGHSRRSSVRLHGLFVTPLAGRRPFLVKRTHVAKMQQIDERAPGPLQQEPAQQKTSAQQKTRRGVPPGH